MLSEFVKATSPEEAIKIAGIGTAESISAFPIDGSRDLFRIERTYTLRATKSEYCGCCGHPHMWHGPECKWGKCDCAGFQEPAFPSETIFVATDIPLSPKPE